MVGEKNILTVHRVLAQRVVQLTLSKSLVKDKYWKWNREEINTTSYLDFLSLVEASGANLSRSIAALSEGLRLASAESPS